ncbi:RodZ domain-containing protein [Alteromonas sp. a30]|uniref:RodZ domain-containing protein n=1 Tax=Alteromonas sp. a30 TaxID=2730917 RepID=UPI002282D97D|nr:RodZ domain-containing protein [Alteromonas sp. a30]MCY7294589.1 DUF4115 domain-containing protein [Alteromonas sp. a30]
MSKNDDTLEEVEFVGPGAMLRTARKKLGLSQDEVAEKLHLRASIISSLEDDQYSADISPTFTKGYLKLYSKLLGLNADDVLDAYKKLGKLEKEPAKLQSFSKQVARQASDQRLMMVTYLVLVIVIALVVAWWFQQDEAPFESMISGVQKKETTSPKEETKPEVEESLQSNALPVISDTSETESMSSPSDTAAPENDATESMVNDVTDDNVETSETSEISETTETSVSESADIETTVNELPPQVDTSSEEVSSDQQEVQPVPVDIEVTESNSDNTEQEQKAAVEEGADATTTTVSEALDIVQEPSVPLGDAVDLVFEFAGDCWMKLTDATGEDVAYGIKKSGRVMPVSGIPPFEVVLGAPEVVQISYNGEAIDMTQFRAGYTARFTLPLSE